MEKSSYDTMRGRKLTKDIPSEHGAVLLGKEQVLTDERLDKLRKHNAKDVFEQQNSGGRQMVNEAVEQFRSVAQFIYQNNRIPLMDVKTNIIPVVKTMAEDKNLFSLFSDLQAKDEYTYRHNIAVGVLATLIGGWMNLEVGELSALTIAATLHDIGKLKVPDAILNKPGKLSAEEYEFMKKHTVLGYELIRSTVGTSHRQALVALQHHEREDGSGYPLKVTEDKIDLFSKIVSVADVFHAMSSRRVYQDVSSFYRVVSELQNEMHLGHLNVKVAGLFIQKIMDHLVGYHVELSDGRIGQILMLNPQEPIRPLIKLGDGYVDLSRVRNLEITQIFSV